MNVPLTFVTFNLHHVLVCYSSPVQINVFILTHILLQQF
jgi:hypothetical protein